MQGRRGGRACRASLGSARPAVSPARGRRAILEVGEDEPRVGLGRRVGGPERHLGRRRWLVGVVDAGELGDLSGPRPCVPALHVPRLHDRQRRVHEDLHEARRPARDHLADLGARLAVRAHEGGHGEPPMTHDLAGHVADAADVGVSVGAREAEAGREMRPHHVAVEDGDLAATRLQERHERRRGRRLAGPGEAREPDAGPSPSHAHRPGRSRSRD